MQDLGMQVQTVINLQSSSVELGMLRAGVGRKNSGLTYDLW